LREISIKSYETAEGKTELGKFEQLLQEYEESRQETNTSATPTDEFITERLGQLCDHQISGWGFEFRLGTLALSLGRLRQGDFGFVFARPETGKTTFLASEVSFFLTQISEREDLGPIIWFNNEEQGEKVKIRVYQAFFGVTLEELYANIPKYEKEFEEQTKGKFLINKDSFQTNKESIETVCKQLKPSLILFDQIDKIKGFEADREDLHLGAIYQWARELAKAYCPVIGICQADGTGENVRYLTMGNVANAKTSKQAEADWILGIGAIHDTGWESVRFMNISKNKLMGDAKTDPKLRHGKFEVLIDPERARYKDMP
jgi:replicative DNA helicase